MDILYIFKENYLNQSIFRKKIADYLDLSLLKDFVYLNIALGISFALCSDGVFFTLQPMYMYQIGFSKVILIYLN